MASYHILGVVIKNRKDIAPRVQETLTAFGGIIRTRLGLHDVCTEDECHPNEGLLILHLSGSDKQIGNLMEELNAIAGVSADYMCLTGTDD